MNLHSPLWLARRTRIERDTLAMLAARGVTGWKVEFHHTIAFAGRCVYAPKTIKYSIPFMLYANETQIAETIAHETAHAILGPGFGHDSEWAELCVDLGGSGRRQTGYPQPLYNSKNFEWIGVCSNCSARTGSNTMPDAPTTCIECKDRVEPLARIHVWYHKEVLVPHHQFNESYVKIYNQAIANVATSKKSA